MDEREREGRLEVYNRKDKLDEQTMALRAAKELRDGMIVNLGVGVPTQCANFVPEGREIIFHAEHGYLGYGPIASREESDIHYTTAGGQPANPLKGASFFAQDESFAMIRGGHIDLTVLGGLQVSEKGDLANWMIPGRGVGNMGGALDLAGGAKQLIIIMRHLTPKGDYKIVKQCSFPVTVLGRVSLVVTDIAVIEVANGRLVLKETCPGWTKDEIQALSEPALEIHPELKEMEL
jgi:3-oxoacid CoA-transferase B subunit